MPKPRKRLVSLDDTPHYHCISRCVRRRVSVRADELREALEHEDEQDEEAE